MSSEAGTRLKLGCVEVLKGKKPVGSSIGPEQHFLCLGDEGVLFLLKVNSMESFTS